MRSLAFLALAFSSTALGQTLTTLTGGTNQGNVGGGLYFDLQINTTVTLTQLMFQVGAGTVAGSLAAMECYLGPSTYDGNVTNPSLWTLVGTTVPQLATGGVAQMLTAAITPVPQIAAVTLAPGNYGFALKSVLCSHGYTNGTGCTSSTIPGSCTNSTFSTPEMTLRGGAAQNVFLAGGIFSPRIFNGAITYTVGGTPITFAQRQPYGNGCYARYRSFYEFMPSTATGQDLSNTSFLLTYDSSSNRYINITGGTTPVTPVTSPSLGHTDDSVVTVNLLNAQPIIYPDVTGPGLALTTVEMCSNMYVNLNGTNPNTSNPTVAEWLAGTPRIGNHHDADPSVGGTTHYDYDVATGAHLFTWNGVFDFGIAASPNTMQLAFFANGNVEFRFGAMSLLGGGGWPTLVGYSPGQSALDPGSIDITASFPFSTSSIDQNPLTLSGDVNPVLGSTVNLTTSGETGLSLGLCFFGLSDLPPFSPVGLDLGVIGAPGCVANIDTTQAVGNLISNLGLPGTSMTVPFGVPSSLAFIGTSLFTQSAWVDATQNPGGIITSNALRLRIGSF
jgi:hypothetical protein